MARVVLVEPGQDPMKVWRAQHKPGRRFFGFGGLELNGMTIFYGLCALAFGYYLWTAFGPKMLPANPTSTPTSTPTLAEVAQTLIPSDTPGPTATATPSPTTTPTATGILPTVALPDFVLTRLPKTPTPGP